jgi:hypothetical protein
MILISNSFDDMMIAFYFLQVLLAYFYDKNNVWRKKTLYSLSVLEIMQESRYAVRNFRFSF